LACADDTSLSATGTEIELSRLRRKSPGFGGDTLLRWLQIYRQTVRGAHLHRIRRRGRSPGWQTSTGRPTQESTIESNFCNSKQTYKGPKIVDLFQGLDPPDEGSGKLIDVGILSGSLWGVILAKKLNIYKTPYSIFGLAGQGWFCSS
jgi:hypothetical protein